MPTLSKRLNLRCRRWLVGNLKTPAGPHSHEEGTHSWWKVMCLTGVDYFSTLGYQPGIAFLAAGYLSPIATLVLVLVTLLAAYPVYSRVAENSPEGQGSIAMLEKLTPGWYGKLLVLALLGFAATDFIITITLSAADATAHALENPFIRHWAPGKMGVTVFIVLALAAVFLKGFSEAIGLAVGFVGVYLSLSLVVVVMALAEVFQKPDLLQHWADNLLASHSNPWAMAGVALLLFPKLALGLSGFETGVAVMPQIACDGKLENRIRNTRKLLLTAALIMSFFLITSSLVTSLLIPAVEFQEGHRANGRALAYLAHHYLGNAFGTVYDLSTIGILGFAGASAMAGLLNLVPRYLPRFGMAPEWARTSRPMVLVFTLIAVAITILFKADVDAQGGAYATGVLVLMSSAAIAVTISKWHSIWRLPYLAAAIVFGYTTIVNILERPEGIRIATFFVFLTIAVSLLSRAMRATELRITTIEWDPAARRILEDDRDQVIRIVANTPGPDSPETYAQKDAATRELHHLSADEQIIFLEIVPLDASKFDARLEVHGITVQDKYHIWRASSPAVPNAIAAMLLDIMKTTGKRPHAYLGWTEGNPVASLFRFLFFGEGDVAPITREVLRKKIANPLKRPIVHVS